MKRDSVQIVLILSVFMFLVIFLVNVFKLENNNTQYNKNIVLSESNTNQETIIEENNEQVDLQKKINSANRIVVTEEFISFNKKYNLYINDEYIGNISGKFVNITGDVFTLKDKNGNVVSSEKQIKRWGIKLNRMAEVRDKSNRAIRLYWGRCNKGFILY